MDGEKKTSKMYFIYEVDGASYEYEVTSSSFTIGRSPKCDLSIPHKSVSKKHAQCFVEGEEILVRDMGSSNGTRINGREIVEAYLSDRDVLEVGLVKLLLRVEREAGEEEDVPSTLSGMACELVLKIKSPNYRKTVSFVGRKVTIGSHSKNDIALKEMGVSRFHAELFPTPTGGWMLKDLGSRNGTKVNDKPVQNRILKDGDIIQIGAATLQVHLRMVDFSKPQEKSKGLLKHPLFLFLIGVVFVILLLPAPKSSSKESSAELPPEHTKRFHKLLEKSLELWKLGRHQEAREFIQKLLDRYPDSELVRALDEVTRLWLAFLKRPFHFKDWGAVQNQLAAVEEHQEVYLERWKDLTNLRHFLKDFREQVKLEQKGRALFLKGQLQFKNGSYEQALKSFNSIPQQSLYYKKAQAFIYKKRIKQKVYLQYMSEVRRLEREALTSPDKYLAVIQLLEELRKKYANNPDNLRQIQERIRRNKINYRSLRSYLKAKSFLAKQQWQKAIEAAQEVDENSPYWQGRTGAKRILEFAKAQLDFAKAQDLYSRGLAPQAIKILDELILKFNFQEVKSLRQHIAKIHKWFQRAQKEERQNNPYLAMKYYKKVIQKEVNRNNYYYQKASERYHFLKKRITRNAKRYFLSGKKALSQGFYDQAYLYFRKTLQYDLDNHYFVKIQGLVQEKSELFFQKAQDLEIQPYSYSQKLAFALYKILVQFLPQDSPLRQKAQKRIVALQGRVKLEEK